MKTWYQLITEIRGYEPKDKHFTSKEEMDMLNNHFGLDKMTAVELQNLREMFMLYFISTDHDKAFSSNAMMSITAVIDHYKIQKGGMV